MTTRRERFAFLLLVLLAGCGGSGAPRDTAPVLLVGVDGLDWSVALPLLHDGRMPNLEALMRRGRYGRLETIAPARSPVIWTSIATGRDADAHGILDFTFDGPDGTRRLYSSADRRTKALWNILDDAGRRAIFVSWWNSYPAEPVDGIIVAQANTLEQIARRRMLKPGGLLLGADGQVHPPARQDELLAIAEQVDREMPILLQEIFGDIGRAERPGDLANLEACAWSVRADESTRRIGLRLAAETPAPDLFAVYFGTPDVVAHRFWRFHEPESFEHPPPPDALLQFGAVIVDAYVRADEIIGEMVAAFPADTTVFVVSDHGMHAENIGSRFDVPVDGRLERESGGHDDGPPGIFVAAGPGIRPAQSLGEPIGGELPVIGHALDIAPTLLALLDLPVGRDMNGSVLDEVLDEALLRERPVTYVDSHDTPEWLETRSHAAPVVPGTEERLEQLRSLGYIEGSTGSEENP